MMVLDDDYYFARRHEHDDNIARNVSHLFFPAAQSLPNRNSAVISAESVLASRVGMHFLVTCGAICYDDDDDDSLKHNCLCL